MGGFEDEIRELEKKGFSVRQISKQIGMSRKDVNETLEKKVLHSGLRTAGWIAAAIAAGAIAICGGVQYFSRTDLTEQKVVSEEYQPFFNEAELLEEARNVDFKEFLEGEEREKIEDVLSDGYVLEDIINIWNEQSYLALLVLNKYIELKNITKKDTKLFMDFAERYSSAIKNSKYLSDNFNAILRCYELSKNADSELPGFLEHLDRNWKQVYERIENKEFEQGGIIVKKNSSYEIVFKEDPTDKMIEYFEELKNGNVMHERKLVQFLEREVKFYINDVEEQSDTLEGIKLILDMYKNPDKHQDQESQLVFKKLSKLVGPIIKEAAQNTYLSGTTSYLLGPLKELLDPESGVIFRWHHHPKSKKREAESPSPPDKETTMLYGPQMVFSVGEDKLEVYHVNLGESKLVRTYRK